MKSYETESILRVSDFTKEERYQTRHGEIKFRLAPAFEVLYNHNFKSIFRDIPDAVLHIFLAYAAQHYKDIFFLMVLSAFAGLRPSEACNVRQECSPLGSGLTMRKTNGKVTRIVIDLTVEKKFTFRSITSRTNQKGKKAANLSKIFISIYGCI